MPSAPTSIPLDGAGADAPGLRQGHAQLVSPDGHESEIPQPIYDLVCALLSSVGDPQVLSPALQRQPVSTSSAAQMLGVSRPFLVRLLEKGEIRFHRVGRHRRIHLADVLVYLRHRDSALPQPLLGTLGAAEESDRDQSASAALREREAAMNVQRREPDSAELVNWQAAMQEWDSPLDHENYDDL